LGNRALSGEGIRSFIAVEITEPAVLENLRRLGTTLTETGADLRLVEVKNLHITLRFLGNVPRSLIDEANGVLDTIEFQPFDVVLKGVGVFPSMQRINVVWVGIEQGSAELLHVFSQLEPKLRRMGFKPDRRGFVPHITVARVKSGRNRDVLANTVSNVSGMEFGGFGVDAIKLKKSVLTPKGPMYSTIHEVAAREGTKERE
jgi:2'-5' RNA ligase